MDKWNKLYMKEFYRRNGDKEKGERIPEDPRTSSPCIFQQLAVHLLSWKWVKH